MYLHPEFTWHIHPDKAPSLDWDDWHLGFEDADDAKFPQHPYNPCYMAGWLQCFGMAAGYANQLPTCKDPAYMEGYEMVQHERGCHNPSIPDIRESSK